MFVGKLDEISEEEQQALVDKIKATEYIESNDFSGERQAVSLMGFKSFALNSFSHKRNKNYAYIKNWYSSDLCRSSSLLCNGGDSELAILSWKSAGLICTLSGVILTIYDEAKRGTFKAKGENRLLAAALMFFILVGYLVFFNFQNIVP